MEIVIKTNELELEKKFLDFAEKKLKSLEKFLKFFYIEKKPATFWLDFKKTSRRHKKGLIFEVDCRLEIPGYSFRTRERGEELKLLIGEIKEELERQLKDTKEKIIASQRKGARFFKDKLKNIEKNS